MDNFQGLEERGSRFFTERGDSKKGGSSNKGGCKKFWCQCFKIEKFRLRWAFKRKTCSAFFKSTYTLQQDLNKIYKWSDIANMVLNDIKFELLRYGINNELKEATSYKTPSGATIKEKNVVKDLGVQMTNDCLFEKQISSVIEKAKIPCGFRAHSKQGHWLP